MVPSDRRNLLCVIIAVITNFALVTTLSNDDFRYISYQDLQESVNKFTRDGVTAYSQMLFDVSRNQMLVGARDSLFRLSLSKLRLLEESKWYSPVKTSRICIDKGQSEENCHNFIKVLQTNGRQVFVCGTNSFSPICSWREIENISNVTGWDEGKAKCPYSPSENLTSLISQNGAYYFGGPTEFSSSESVISKSFGRNPMIRTKQYNSFWLNEPQFVGSFETEKFVYFLFREAAVEYINCGKAVYSRIARVCKNDSGGNTMLKDNWTTFIKARLNCSITGDYPFYFNEIQSMSYVSDQNTVYATFTTSPNSIAGSAICAFNLTAIDVAFAGSFKHQAQTGGAWNRHDAPSLKEHFECRASHQKHVLLETSKYQLMDSAVQATTLSPLHVAQLERFTHITVDVVATKLHTSVNVIYVATLEGLIKKITVLPRTRATCLVEVWQTVPDTYGPVKNMQFLKETNSVYITTTDNLMQIPAEHCNRHSSKDTCINAMDPYCGWNELDEKCTPPPGADPLNTNWKQDASTCPVLDAPVDGGWSSWSDWEPCIHRLQSDTADSCICQSRKCNNPSPANLGKSCEGPSVAVTNCTVHGDWSDWSAWSACSATCGTAVKTRFRTCSNPEPAFGGRVCVGQDRTEAFCSEIPPCPPAPLDGGWSSWSAWSPCSANCGTGYKSRHRKCDRPTPKNGGQFCAGNDLEYSKCNEHDCNEHKRTQPTVWITDYNITNQNYHQRRFRVTCKAPVKHQGQIKINIREEAQFCVKNDCYPDENDHGWSNWSGWSECTVSCGGGVQNRTRYCRGRGCSGGTTQTKDCNKHPCKQDEWSCWSEWSPCNVSCGWGIKTRIRSCLGENCVGNDREELPCEDKPCGAILGWGNWTEWSLCDENEEQHRKRKCWTSNPGPQMCQGNPIETRMCVSDMMQANAVQIESYCTAVSLLSFLGGVILPIALFGIFKVAAYYHKKKNTIPSSPHYMCAEQNPYISVPTREKPKRHNSTGCSSIIGPNSTLKSGKIFDEFEITTLKRNSHEVKHNGVSKHHICDSAYYD